MTSFTIESRSGAYDVVVGEGVLRTPRTLDCIATAPLVVMITQRAVFDLHGKTVIDGLRMPRKRLHLEFVGQGERSKSVGVATRLWKRLLSHGMTRDSVIVALGGGLVGDLAGFVAATILRGVTWVNVPTTILSQVDAAIGGKTGVNVPQGRNLVGAFHPPRHVIMDTNLLRTLPQRQIRSGVGEVVKYAIAVDPHAWERCLDVWAGEDSRPARTWDWNRSVEVVSQCARAKADIVSEDEHETGRRRVLNAGHTLGHALEGLLPGRYTHGEAVAIGLRFALYLSAFTRRLAPEYFAEALALLDATGLPMHVPPEATLARLAPFLELDKKRSKAGLTWVLPTGPGRAAFVDDVPKSAIERSLRLLRG